jgi:hypothetical protein
MNKEELLRVITEKSATFNGMADNWSTITKENKLNEQLMQQINPDLNTIIPLLN